MSDHQHARDIADQAVSDIILGARVYNSREAAGTVYVTVRAAHPTIPDTELRGIVTAAWAAAGHQLQVSGNSETESDTESHLAYLDGMAPGVAVCGVVDFGRYSQHPTGVTCPTCLGLVHYHLTGTGG